MAFDRLSGQVEVTFREVRLPRPMRVNYPRDPGRLADEWTRRAALLVAEVEDICVGYLSLSNGTAPESAWVTDLVVDPLHRRGGIGTQLLNAVRQWCEEREFSRLFIEMQSKNYPGIMLAKKARFEFSGYSDHYYPNGDIALFFARELS